MTTEEPKVEHLFAEPPQGRVIYKEPRFELRACELVLSDGSTESRGLIVHPGAVVIVPILGDGRIVMIQNRRWQIGQILLELPAGTREKNEAPEACAQRELREETGYRADKFIPLNPFFAAPGVSTEIMYPYLATGLTFVGQSLALDEEIDTKLMSQEDLQTAILNGSIQDGKTLAVLSRWMLRSYASPKSGDVGCI